MQHDLDALNIACHPQPAPEFASSAQMLGAVYVLEASRMSARVMLARLAENPDSEAMKATAYLRHGFGKRFWPSFLNVLETDPSARNNIADVVRGAQIAFAMFESALAPMDSAIVLVPRADNNGSYSPTP